MPGDDTDSTGDTTSATTEDTSDDSTGSTGVDDSTSDGSTSSTSADTTSGGMDSDNSTGDPLPMCIGDACDDACGPGLACLPHPLTGERMCMTLCPAYFCDITLVSCGTFAPTTCIMGACVPALCEALADCPDGSVKCDGSLCY